MQSQRASPLSGTCKWFKETANDLGESASPVVASSASMFGQVDVFWVVELGVGRVEDGVDHPGLQVQQHGSWDVVLIVCLGAGVQGGALSASARLVLRPPTLAHARPPASSQPGQGDFRPFPSGPLRVGEALVESLGAPGRKRHPCGPCPRWQTPPRCPPG